MGKVVQGLQLFSVKNALKADEIGVIRALSDMGYANVEVNDPGFVDGKIAPVRPAEQTRAIYGDLGVRVITAAMNLDRHTNLDDWKQLVEYSCRIGSRAVVCGVGTFKDREQLFARADLFNRIGEFARQNGQEFYYHNHYQEFMRIQGEVVFDTLMRRTQPDLVGVELDVFWLVRGGVEPIGFMDGLGERLKVVHFKDLNPDVAPCILDRIPAGQAIGWEEFLQYANQPEAFVELGRGCIDLQSIAQKVEQMPGIWAAVVEQDASAIGELESARANAQYLKALFQ